MPCWLGFHSDGETEVGILLVCAQMGEGDYGDVSHTTSDLIFLLFAETKRVA